MLNREANDPGSVGRKLSKSGGVEEIVEQRNKSYEKVLAASAAWIDAFHEQQKNPSSKCDCHALVFEDATEANCKCGILFLKWRAKSQWHEKEFGW